MRLTIQDFVMLAKFIQVREDCGGAVKILDQDEYNPLRVVIDWHITAELLDEYNRLRGQAWTQDKPTVPGWYWLKWGSDATPSEAARPINITLAMIRFTFQPGPITPEMFGGDLEVFTIGNDAPKPLDEFGQGIQWAGPLEPPV